MSTSRTLQTQQPTSSTDNGRKTVTVSLHVPQSWGELTQEQLRYALWLLSKFGDHTVVKTYMFMRFCGLECMKKTRFGWKLKAPVDGKMKVLYLRTWQIQSFIHQLDYIDSYETMDCRLDAVQGFHAVDVLLHGVSFDDYLGIEKYYQAFVLNNDMKWIEKMAAYLYTDDNGENAIDIKPEPEETLGTLLWYSHVKLCMSREFPHFFKPAPADGDNGNLPDYMALYNNMLRALTDGDITKEKAVRQMDCWRALTELDAKARDAEELERIRKKH